MNDLNTYLDKLETAHNIKPDKKPIYLQPTSKQKQQACKVTKIGKLHKANRAVKIGGKRANLEVEFMRIAAIENKKAKRAKDQREARRAKR